MRLLPILTACLSVVVTTHLRAVAIVINPASQLTTWTHSSDGSANSFYLNPLSFPIASSSSTLGSASIAPYTFTNAAHQAILSGTVVNQIQGTGPSFHDAATALYFSFTLGETVNYSITGGATGAVGVADLASTEVQLSDSGTLFSSIHHDYHLQSPVSFSHQFGTAGGAYYFNTYGSATGQIGPGTYLFTFKQELLQVLVGTSDSSSQGAFSLTLSSTQTSTGVPDGGNVTFSVIGSLALLLFIKRKRSSV